jgi:hypothetical protein
MEPSEWHIRTGEEMPKAKASIQTTPDGTIKLSVAEGEQPLSQEEALRIARGLIDAVRTSSAVRKL